MKLINILKEMSLDTSNLPDGGDCFNSAYEYMVENGPSNKNLKLVHSVVSGQGKLSGKRYTHAWCENDNNVIDTSNGNNFQVIKMLYYVIGNVNPNGVVQQLPRWEENAGQEARQRTKSQRAGAVQRCGDRC